MNLSNNLNPHFGLLQHTKLEAAIQAQGESWASLIKTRCPHLFAPVSVVIELQHKQKMQAVIEAIHRVTETAQWCAISQTKSIDAAQGVFYGYDFHLSEQGVQLIEINTNAGGGWVNALLQHSQNQMHNHFPSFIAMFENEWHLCKGQQPLKTILITDELPEQQYLYPEFLLAQRIFQQAGYRCLIADPKQLILKTEGLYLGDDKIDLVYNRLTDFYLADIPALKQAYLAHQVVVTPSPQHYQQLADKRNLAWLTNAELLRSWSISEDDIHTLQSGIPHCQLIEADKLTTEEIDRLWACRKQYFFKPWQGYGSKGTYAGNKLTKRVFNEIVQSNYLAQQLAPPAQRAIIETDNLFKYDVRCYSYQGKIQLMAARLYQGQTTNFRTENGGFACIID